MLDAFAGLREECLAMLGAEMWKEGQMAGLLRWDETYFLDAIHDDGYLTRTSRLCIVVCVRKYSAGGSEMILYDFGCKFKSCLKMREKERHEASHPNRTGTGVKSGVD